MKTLYIECNMGAAGDMLMSALSELHPAGRQDHPLRHREGVAQRRAAREDAPRARARGGRARA